MELMPNGAQCRFWQYYQSVMSQHPHADGSRSLATLRVLDGRIVGSYPDLRSGALFVYARPRDQPWLWREFLRGALESYGRYGVESVLEYDSVRDGSTTTMFIAALDAAGNVVGGMRAQGRYSTPGQAHAVSEWAGHPGEALLWGDIDDRLRFGVIEMKSGWVSESTPMRRQLTAALARVVLHSMRLLEVRYALCTVAQHAVHRWETTGARVSSMIPAVAYPDDRYKTVPMWWDIESAEDLSSPEHWAALAAEWTDLTATQPASRWVDSSERAAA
jgi:hypothetical protein